MHRSIKRLIVLPASVLVVLAAWSGTASAVTLTVNPTPASIIGSGTTGSRITLGSTTISCTSETISGTWRSNSGSTFPVIAGMMTPQYPATGGTCTATGGVSVSFSCFVQGLGATGFTDPSRVTAAIYPWACTITATATCSVVIAGTIPASYHNGTGQLLLRASGQALRSSNSNCALFPNNTTATYTSTAGSDFAYNISIVGRTSWPTITVT
jgi:hypothetical protein